ncbi:hypothetical protein ACVWZA_002898 [Sphingomonas sp. UYAg733]
MIRGFLLAALIAVQSVAAAASEPVVVIKPGQSAIIKPEADGSVTVVTANPLAGQKPARGEIRVDLTYGDKGTMLVVTSNADKFMRYKAVMLLDGGKMEPTSVCTLMTGGKMSIESWPYPIKAIALGQFVAVDDENMTCE